MYNMSTCDDVGQANKGKKKSANNLCELHGVLGGEIVPSDDVSLQGEQGVRCAVAFSHFPSRLKT
jgi:hypothetical protein